VVWEVPRKQWGCFLRHTVGLGNFEGGRGGNAFRKSGMFFSKTLSYSTPYSYSAPRVRLKSKVRLEAFPVNILQAHLGGDVNLVVDGDGSHVDARGYRVVLVLHPRHDIRGLPVGFASLRDHCHGNVGIADGLLDGRLDLGRARGELKKVVHGIDFMPAPHKLLSNVDAHLRGAEGDERSDEQEEAVSWA